MDYSPFFLNYGYHPTYVADIPQYSGPDVELTETFDHYLDRMGEDWEHVNKMFKCHRERIINKANEKRTTWSYEPGDMVLVDARNHHRTRAQKEARPGHLDPKAIGPFEVERAIGPNTYQLYIPPTYHTQMHPVFHVQDLIPYVIQIPGDDELSEAASEAPGGPDPPQEGLPPPPPGHELSPNDLQPPLQGPVQLQDEPQPQSSSNRGQADTDPSEIALPLPEAEYPDPAREQGADSNVSDQANLGEECEFDY